MNTNGFVHMTKMAALKLFETFFSSTRADLIGTWMWGLPGLSNLLPNALQWGQY